MASMKLYVVGEKSADPDDWSIWSEPALVLAANPREALSVGNGWDPARVVEIPMDQPRLLMKMPEPAHGDDL